MKKVLILLAFIPYLGIAQNTIPKGTYISNEKDLKLKLRISDDSQYDLSVFSGSITQKNDTIVLETPKNEKNVFDLNYSFGSKSDKISLRFIDLYDYYNLYIGTQNDSEPINYKKLSTVTDENPKAYNAGTIWFEIDRSHYLYLVEEDSYKEKKTKIFKYFLPENVSEISIKYNAYLDTKGILLMGTYKKESNEIVISENGRNPMTFQLESEIKPKLAEKTILPTESKEEANWTYPDKTKTDEVTATETVDTATSADNDKPKLQFVIENNLVAALQSTKKLNKILAIYYDPNSKNAKQNFDDFIKYQETELNYNSYDGYDAKFDKYIYYQATKQDTKWLKNNKIKDFPAIIITNGDGEVLSVRKENLDEIKYDFGYYSDFYTKLNRTNTLVNFNKTINAKYDDTAIINAFAKVTALDLPYSYDATDAVIAPPMLPADGVKETPIEEVKKMPEEQIAVDAATKAADEAATAATKAAEEAYNLTAVKIDATKTEEVWNKLITSHQNDSKPNMSLVISILKEVKNEGFTKQLFGTEKLLNDTNFLAIDYMIKHQEAIEVERLNNKSTYEDNDPIKNLQEINTEIGNALRYNSNFIGEKMPILYSNKLISSYKKLLNTTNSNTDSYRNYFDLLKSTAEKTGIETTYIDEYDTFFNKTFDGKSNIIEKLDDLYKQKDSNYDDWNTFKNYYANLANDMAWFVVEKSKNASNIKKAIIWSETSLKIEKNTHFYLDTLAQLYYKNGEKDKAIATEQKAIDVVSKDTTACCPDNLDEYKTVLEKMKNGSY